MQWFVISYYPCSVNHICCSLCYFPIFFVTMIKRKHTWSEFRTGRDAHWSTENTTCEAFEEDTSFRWMWVRSWLQMTHPKETGTGGTLISRLAPVGDGCLLFSMPATFGVGLVESVWRVEMRAWFHFHRECIWFYVFSLGVRHRKQCQERSIIQDPIKCLHRQNPKTFLSDTCPRWITVFHSLMNYPGLILKRSHRSSDANVLGHLSSTRRSFVMPPYFHQRQWEHKATYENHVSEKTHIVMKECSGTAYQEHSNYPGPMISSHRIMIDTTIFEGSWPHWNHMS